jgi:uncharacterized protein (DUF1800 family)
MVDRLTWRAGFGPTEAARSTLKGLTLHKAVDRLIAAPQGPLTGPEPVRSDGTPLQPLESDTDLVLSWCDRMLRTGNPLVERLTLFWHRHFATSRLDVSPPQLIADQNTLLRRYSDFATYPTANFRTLVYEVGEGPAMLRFLTGEDSTKKSVNENYGRELMELFCLGVVNAAGQPNYTEVDVREAARAASGWQVDDEDPDAAIGYFNRSRWDDGQKTVLGKTGAFSHRELVDVVLAHANHPPFLMAKLWTEFHPAPPDAATLRDLILVYTRSGFRLKPVVRRILTHPGMLDSIGEPNMVKPPIVHAVGTMRALGLGVTDQTLYQTLSEMGQLPYFPPSVAGWEGGLSWLNTNTAIARFGMANRLLSKQYAKLPTKAPEDVAAETAVAAFDRAHVAVGRPWLAAGTVAALRAYADKAPAKTSNDRIARQRVLRAFMLGGPDAQVM